MEKAQSADGVLEKAQKAIFRVKMQPELPRKFRDSAGAAAR
jgi:hypothetical protein